MQRRKRASFVQLAGNHGPTGNVDVTDRRNVDVERGVIIVIDKYAIYSL